MTDITINSDASLGAAITALTDAYRQHRYIEIEIKRKAGQRTLTQNAALHKFCQLLADALNDAGFDMKAVLRHDAEIPWTMPSVKEHLWRPVQKALTEKTSTTEITTVEPTAIHETLCRHLADKLGVACPAWPTRKRERIE